MEKIQCSVMAEAFKKKQFFKDNNNKRSCKKNTEQKKRIRDQKAKCYMEGCFFSKFL